MEGTRVENHKWEEQSRDVGNYGLVFGDQRALFFVDPEGNEGVIDSSTRSIVEEDDDTVSVHGQLKAEDSEEQYQLQRGVWLRKDKSGDGTPSWVPVED